METTRHNNQTAEESEENKSDQLINYKWTISIPTHPSELNCSIKNHSSTVYHNYMYVFGGFDGSINHTNLKRLDLNTLKWDSVPTIGTPPKNRNGHTATLVNNMLYIIGG